MYKQFVKNMVYICGEAAYKFGHKTVRNFATFTHYPQNNFIADFLKSYTHFYTRSFTHTCTQKCVQFVSVNSRFYTLYTAPTITTTLNN